MLWSYPEIVVEQHNQEFRGSWRRSDVRKQALRKITGRAHPALWLPCGLQTNVYVPRECILWWQSTCRDRFEAKVYSPM